MVKRPPSISIELSKLTEEDLTKIGELIIARVKLNLASGDAAGLARESIDAVNKAYGPSADTVAKEGLKLIKSIEKHADLLAADLEKYGPKFFSEFSDFKNRLGTAMNVKKSVYEFGSSSKNGSRKYPDSLTIRIYLGLDPIYRKFFGKKAAYTESDNHNDPFHPKKSETYPGPFWDFIRAIKDVTKASFNEPGIRKGHQRIWKYWLAEGLTVKETNHS
jgi:hypothetical protein